MKLQGDAITPDAYREVMSSWTTGVAIITAPKPKDSDFPIGIVCNSLTSISLEKRLFLWTVDHSSSSYKYWITAQNWVVHFLATGQEDLVKRFSAKGVANKYEGLSFDTSAEGAPLLSGVVTRLYCTTENKFETFDHTIILGQVHAVEGENRTPLTFVHRKLFPGTPKPS